MSDEAEYRRLQGEVFEAHRSRLRAVAYRMLGSAGEADDAVQEAWLRLDRTEGGDIDNLGAWLTTVVGRVCLDMLRARRARREDPAGAWLPEAVVDLDPGSDPQQQSEIADSVGVALLVVLQTLTPAERLAFVLHDTFGLAFTEIAPIVERSPQATRQLASRARRRVRGARTPEADLVRQREVVEAFLTAARGGDFGRLLELLDPDVVFTRRGARGFGPELLTGADPVAREIVANGPRFLKHCRPAVIDDAVGILVQGTRGPIGVVHVGIAAGRVTELELVTHLATPRDRR